MLKAAVLLQSFLLLLLVACSSEPRSVPFPKVEIASEQISASPIQWSNAFPCTVHPSEIGILNSSHDTTIDLGNLKQGKLDIGGFVSLTEPMDSRPLDFNLLRDTSIDPSKLPTQPLQYKTCLLGEPTKIKTGVPRIKDDATDAILFFSQEQGIHPGMISNSMAQDKAGRLWIGTKDGLCMFDGENSYVYTSLQGLCDNRVWNVAIDSEGHIWCGGFAGLDMIDPDRGIINHVNSAGWLHDNYIFDILFDHRGKLWTATNNGMIEIDVQKKILRRIDITEGLSSHTVRTLIEDHEGKIWAGTTNGITIFDPATHDLRYINTENGIGGKVIRAILEDHSGGFWIGTEDNGVSIYSPITGTLKSFTKRHGLSTNNVRTIAEDAEHHVLIGMVGYGGVTIFDPQTEKIRRVTTTEGLTNDQIVNFFLDRNNQMWIHSSGGGANIFGSQIGSLKHLSVKQGLGSAYISTLCEDSSGNIWMGGIDGLEVFDPKSGLARDLSLEQVLSRNRITNSYADRHGRIWLTTIASGVSLLDLKSGRVRNFGQKQDMCNYGTERVIEDDSGYFWVSTISGVNRLDLRTGNNLRIDYESGLSSRSTNDILEDQNKKFWIAGTGGLDILDQNTWALHHLEIMAHVANKTIDCIFQDNERRIWLGTHEDGVYVVDSAQKTIRHFSTNEGLVNQEVSSFVEDHGKIYVGTLSGLTVINFKPDGEPEFTNYGKAEGFGAIDFRWCSALRSSQGDLWWGIGENVTILKPGASDTVSCPTLISGIDIMGKETRFLTNRWLQTKLRNTDTIYSCTQDTCYFSTKLPPDHNEAEALGISWDSVSAPYFMPANLKLPYNQNHLTFHFTGTRTSNFDQTRYRYIIEGIDEKWSTVTKESFADYRNLPPGTYTFKVSSRGINRVWSVPAELHFIITPPWWQTRFAYFTYALVIGLSFFGFTKRRTAIFLNRQKELERTVRDRTSEVVSQKDEVERQKRVVELQKDIAEEQRIRAERSEKFKEQFLANMSHEIRTPMNAVMGMTNILIDKSPREDQAAYLENIRKSSETLLVILNEILDLSKIEAGKMELERIPFELKNSFELVRQTMQYKAEEKGLRLVFEIADDVPQFLIGDPIRLQQVLINLTGNAIKFTHRGEVCVQCTRRPSSNSNEATLLFEVTDTGIGMTDDELGRIFETFRQASSETTRKFGGTGLGLSISRHLIELQGGTVSVRSKPGEGSTFSFAIHYGIGT
ncbi:MAG: two-component regulator propeller domain-containing protein, partial [Bacteroidota bacterium]|nr:two-component regulator propeller domain-containing protein [Bacteroidota bacterium]